LYCCIRHNSRLGGRNETKSEKKKWRPAPWAVSSTSRAASQSFHGDCRVAARAGVAGPESTVLRLAQGSGAPSRDAGLVPGLRSAWVGWSPGVTPLLAQTHIPTPGSPSPSSSAPENPTARLGFPLDFIGSHSFPHCAAFLSHLWSLPVSSRSSFSGGWCVSSLRPPVIEEEWSRLGSGGFQGPSKDSVMDPKNKNPQNPQWDRWGPKENPQGSQSWNRARNLSWRLKPALGKPEHPEGLMSTSSSEGTQSGNPVISPLALKKEVDPVCPAFCQKCGVEGHHARNCFNALWCDICCKETHITSRCVLPKQNKPTMPMLVWRRMD
jgi:hypothetical protein